jgi:hypothetical protein
MKLLTLLLFYLFPLALLSQTDTALASFIPKGYRIFDRVKGDLNKDGRDDLVLIIKGTDRSKFVMDEDRGELDRNRRGLIVLFSKNGQYEVGLQNYTCFSSENEDGGVYFPPELVVEIEKGNLCIHFAQGRYGFTRYTFRYQKLAFRLIGYDSADRSSFDSDYALFDETSVNFLTQKEVVKKVANVTAAGMEVYKETWRKIRYPKLLSLTAVKDFDELELTY